MSAMSSTGEARRRKQQSPCTLPTGQQLSSFSTAARGPGIGGAGGSVRRRSCLADAGGTIAVWATRNWKQIRGNLEELGVGGEEIREG